MSARAPVPAAPSPEEPPAAAAEKESPSPGASREAERVPTPEREGKPAAREERAAIATSLGARGEPSPAPVLGHSVPQAAVPVRPLALHLAHRACGSGGPFGREPLSPLLLLPPPPPPRDPPAEDAREEEEAAGGSEEKPQPPLPPKENPWTKKPPQHLSPAGSEPPPPPLESPEAGPWLLGGGLGTGCVCRGRLAGGPWPARAGEGRASFPVRGVCSKVSLTLPIYINGLLDASGPRRWDLGFSARRARPRWSRSARVRGPGRAKFR